MYLHAHTFLMLCDDFSGVYLLYLDEIRKIGEVSLHILDYLLWCGYVWMMVDIYGALLCLAVAD